MSSVRVFVIFQRTRKNCSNEKITERKHFSNTKIIANYSNKNTEINIFYNNLLNLKEGKTFNYISIWMENALDEIVLAIFGASRLFASFLVNIFRMQMKFMFVISSRKIRFKRKEGKHFIFAAAEGYITFWLVCKLSGNWQATRKPAISTYSDKKMENLRHCWKIISQRRAFPNARQWWPMMVKSATHFAFVCFFNFDWTANCQENGKKLIKYFNI